MTIKHINKNISAENKNILTNAALSNGILTFTVENLIEDGANRIQSPISIDLLTDMEPITITITYDDANNTTETLTLFKQTNGS